MFPKQIDLGGLLLLSSIFSIFGVSYATVLPAFMEQVLHQGADAYGWVNAVIGLGAVAGAFMITNQHGPSWRGLWLVIAGIAISNCPRLRLRLCQSILLV